MKRFFALITILILLSASTAQAWWTASAGAGDMATDTLWEAAGDLAYGTGPNTAGRLAAGTAYQVLMMNSGATAPAWTSTLGATGTRLTKGWFTEIETSNPLKSGVAGATAGGLVLSNATSGTISLNPATGALGTVAITVPATAGTMAVLASGACSTAGCTGFDGTDKFTWYGANSEDFSLRVGSTANNVIFGTSTGVTDVSFGALNLATTGTVQAGIKISSDADGMDAAAMTAAGMYGTLFIATGAGTWILPTAAVGMSACLMDSGTAHDLILDATAGDTIRLKGTEGADAVGITNASGSTTGDFICVVAVAANKWSTLGMQGTWASQ